MACGNGLIFRALERLLCIISTCDGDDFELLVAKDGGLLTVYRHMCELDTADLSNNSTAAAEHKLLSSACAQV